MTAVSFLFGGTYVSLLDLGNLAEGQLDGRLAPEDRNQHLDLLRVRADLADRGGERCERPVHDRDRLAHLEVDDLDLRLGLLLLGRRDEDPDDLVHGQRRRPRRGADEAGDARGVADRTPRLVVEVHPHEDVAGEDLALHLHALAVLDLGDLFGRHLDLEDVVLHVERGDAALEVGLHLVLVAGVRVDDVPVAGGGAQRAPQLLGRVLVLLGLLLAGLAGLAGLAARGGLAVGVLADLGRRGGRGGLVGLGLVGLGVGAGLGVVGCLHVGGLGAGVLGAGVPGAGVPGAGVPGVGGLGVGGLGVGVLGVGVLGVGGLGVVLGRALGRRRVPRGVGRRGRAGVDVRGRR